MKSLKTIFTLIVLCCALALQSRAQTTSPSALNSVVLPAASPAITRDKTEPSPTGNKTESSSESKAKPADAAKETPALAAEKSAPVHLSKFSQKPTIDGKLDDPVWQSAAILKGFIQIQPGDNIAASKATEVRIGYDDKFIYFGFHAYDDPGKVRATVPKRDDIWEDDNVGMFLDTFNDRRQAYAFFFNPLGIQADGTFTDSRGDDYSVDVVMESKGVLTDDGYTVEVAIPFKSLRYEAGKGKIWNAHFFRRIKRFNNELDSWMPVSRDKNGLLGQAGHLTGLENISTERTLEIIPSLTLSETGKRVRTLLPNSLADNPALLDQGRMLNRPIKLDPGLTMKYSLTPTVTLDFALNPDFAQVEADQTVVTANQRFPIFFEEKRPFFLEGIDIFRTPITAVHTRAIVDPDAAIKLTGKRGRNTFGLMFASDNAPGNFSEEERTDPEVLPGIQKFIDKNAYIGVLRLKHDIGQESSIGLIATSYNFIEKHNQLGGIDGRFKLNPHTVFEFQVLGTTSRAPFHDVLQNKDIYRTGNALAYAYDYNFDKRRYGYEIFGEGYTRDYRADVGFTRRVNTNRHAAFFRVNTNPNPKKALVQFRLGNFSNAIFDWQGRAQGWEDGTNFNFQFKHQTNVRIGTNLEYERLFEEEFGARRTATQQGSFYGKDSERSTLIKTIFFSGQTTLNKKLSGRFFMGTRRGQFDLDFGGGRRYPRVSPAALHSSSWPNTDGVPLDPGPGNSFDVDLSLSYQPTTTLHTSLDYTKARLTRIDSGRVAFNDNIFSLHTTYQFSHFTFVRGRIDYDTLASSVRGQFLLGWTPNPGTAFYVGYNDDLNRNGFNPFTNQLEPGFRRNGRTFFIKTSYLFRHSFGK